MLWNASNIQGYSLQASDEAIGSVNDFLFGDGEWKIRWIVIDTGTWLPGKRVLLPPSALGSPDPGHRSVSANITKKQVEKSPSIDTDAPVSRQHEAEVYGYYGWQPYWGAGMFTSAGGLALAPPVGTGIAPYREDVAEIHAEGDPHLRSISEVTGYYIHAKDGDIGHVEDFLIDSDDWSIRYIVVDTVNWWPGKKVLVSPLSFTNVSWTEETVQTNLSRDHIKNAPEYDPMQTVDRAYEERYLGYYNYPVYW